MAGANPLRIETYRPPGVIQAVGKEGALGGFGVRHGNVSLPGLLSA